VNELGEKVRILREEKGLSRPVFCGDESELSVRQLVRIEKGEFRPTIKTLEYIADRLEIPSYVLMPDYKELPKRYKELKYFLLHHPDYGDKELQEQKEEYFDEIFENFYDDLPRDEKMIVDCLQAIDEVRATDNEQYGIALLDESFEELWNQIEFSFSDLLKIRLYFLCSYLENIKKGQLSISEQQKLQLMFQKVCNNVENSGTDDLFLVRDVLFAGLGSCELLNDLELFKLFLDIKKNYNELSDKYVYSDQKAFYIIYLLKNVLELVFRLPETTVSTLPIRQYLPLPPAAPCAPNGFA